MQIKANIVDLKAETIQLGTLHIQHEKISDIVIEGPENQDFPYAIPGFVDAHVHIESSLLTPAQFARLAVVHGTVGTVSDPHEIANVVGIAGVQYMIADGQQVPFNFCFGAPSCVPATTFETAGATLDVADVATLLAMPEIGYLAEMMNFPGVLAGDESILQKIALAKQANKPVDGHAPGLRGDAAKAYIEAGMSTDHECFTLEEAAEKLGFGMKILIREGSAAKNFDALIPLALEHSQRMMFCSDDKHPDSLLVGHINQLVQRAVAAGVSAINALKMASLNPIEHYNLPIGLLQLHDSADFILVNNLTDFNVQATYLKGTCVARDGESLLPNLPSGLINNFDCEQISPSELHYPAPDAFAEVPVIGVIEGQLITNKLSLQPTVNGVEAVADVEKDMAKLVVVNRYKTATPAVAFVQGFGLKKGAIASSVAHDSHNIIAVGMDDEALAEAINLVIEAKGGLSAVSDMQKGILPLPVAGLMSNEDAYKVAADYTKLDEFAKTQLGSKLQSPYMSLSFMALLVIPSLKLSDLGLFDGDTFQFV